MSSRNGEMDDSREPDVSVNRDDLRGVPRSDEAFNILIPVAKRYYRLLQTGEPEPDDRTHFTNYFGSLDCALRVVQQQDRVGPVDVDDVVAKIDLPRIADTLPFLIEAFERCRPLWEGAHRPELPEGAHRPELPEGAHRPELPEGHPQTDITNTFAVLAYIGSKMYPVSGNFGLMTGYGDLFASDR